MASEAPKSVNALAIKAERAKIFPKRAEDLELEMCEMKSRKEDLEQEVKGPQTFVFRV